MHPTPASRRPSRSVIVACLLAVTAVLSGCAAEETGPRLELTAALPDEVPEDTVLRVGDPQTEVALKLSGLDRTLPFEVEWANVSGGPETLEAFRADAIDVGSVADIPPLFAQWTGTDVKILAARFTQDPLEHPVYRLGVAPGVQVERLEDLEGKKIAYSPGQAQGALVLRVLKKAGLSKDDVELVEMASVDDVYVNALGSNQVDVAPLGQALVATYVAKYERDGGTTIAPGVRDDAWHLYAPTEVVQDADKAAALKEYAKVWAKAVQWVNEHPDEFAQGYYVEHEGLSLEDGRAIVKALGKYEVPTDWDPVIKSHQATADLLEKEQGQEHLDLTEMYDRRFERAVVESGAAGGTS